jgi:hypothetical protein
MPELGPAVSGLWGGSRPKSATDLAAGTLVGQRILQCCFSEKLQTKGTRCFHVLSGDFSGGVAVLLLNSVY